MAVKEIFYLDGVTGKTKADFTLRACVTSGTLSAVSTTDLTITEIANSNGGYEAAFPYAFSEDVILFLALTADATKYAAIRMSRATGVVPLATAAQPGDVTAARDVLAAEINALPAAVESQLSNTHGAGAWGSGQEGSHQVAIKFVAAIAAAKGITAATNANPCKLTIVAHDLATGDKIVVTGVVGMAELINKIYTVTVVDADNITLNGVDSTAYGAYVSGGIIEPTAESAVQNLHVAIYDATDTNLVTTLETDGSGIGAQGANAYALLNPGTYKLRPRMGGFNATGDYTLVVTGAHLGTAAKVFSGTVLSTPLPADPTACRLTADLISFGLAPKAGVKLSAVVKSPPQVASSGQIIDAEPWETTTGNDGRAILDLPQGAKWRIDFPPCRRRIEIDTTGTDSIDLALVVRALNQGG